MLRCYAHLLRSSVTP